MRIENEVKLDFSDVLIRPKRSTLSSRKDVSLVRTFKFKHAGGSWSGVPIIAANMDTTGTLEMHNSLCTFQMMTALHKHYSVEQLYDHFIAGVSPFDLKMTSYLDLADSLDTATNANFSFYSLGASDADYAKFETVYDKLAVALGVKGNSHASGLHPIKMVCLDVANGYSEYFASIVHKIRKKYPHLVIMAGNVVTGEMTEELLISGADIVKVGIGPGSVCTTRKITGVGYPQLSAIIECADAAHGLGGLVCADGGCTIPGDIAKAFGAGADFVMLGGMLAGHDQSGGDLVTEWHETTEVITTRNENLGNMNVEKKFKTFYGMSSETAMNQYSGGVASYRASEGKTVKVPYKGDVVNTVQEILGGVRSAMTYVGAKQLKDLSKCTTFVRVNRQLNEVFGKS